MQNITFDDLFAYRFQCQDTIDNETIIIEKLKYFLYDNNFILEDIDDYIFQFYISLEYPITLEEIKTIQMNVHSESDDNQQDLYNIFEQIINIQPNNITSELPATLPATLPITLPITLPNNTTVLTPINAQTMFSPLMGILFHMMANPENIVGEDIIVTTDQLSKLNKITIDEQIFDKCSICMDKLNIGDIMLDIECKHKFHIECLTEYLEKYNHICPICRTDIGESKINY